VLDLFAYVSIVMYYTVYGCMLSYCNAVRWTWWDGELSGCL